MNIQEELNKYCYIYLHGFASSPKSSKAEFFVNEFKKYDIEVLVPNLNQNDFYNFELSSRQMLDLPPFARMASFKISSLKCLNIIRIIRCLIL